MHGLGPLLLAMLKGPGLKLNQLPEYVDDASKH